MPTVSTASSPAIAARLPRRLPHSNGKSASTSPQKKGMEALVEPTVQPLVSARLRRRTTAGARQGARDDPHDAVRGLCRLRGGLVRLRPAARSRRHHQPDPADRRHQGRDAWRHQADQCRGARLANSSNWTAPDICPISNSHNLSFGRLMDFLKPATLRSRALAREQCICRNSGGQKARRLGLFAPSAAQHAPRSVANFPPSLYLFLTKALRQRAGNEQFDRRNFHVRGDQAARRRPPRSLQQGARNDGAAQHGRVQAAHLGAHPDERAGATALVHRHRRQERCRRHGERPRRRQSAQGRRAPLALEGIQPLPQPHRRDRQQRRCLPDRIRRPPEHPADQSRPRRTPAGHQHHSVRDLDLQSGRRRAGACSQPECQPHHPVRERRLHQCRGRALRGRPRRHHHDAERHLARPRQRGRRARDLDRHAGLAADGIPRLRLGRPGVSRRRLRQQRQEPGRPSMPTAIPTGFTAMAAWCRPLFPTSAVGARSRRRWSIIAAPHPRSARRLARREGRSLRGNPDWSWSIR